MNKFYCGPRHTLSIVYYIAASMGYSREETKRVVGNIENDNGMNEFQKILTEPFYSMQNVKIKGERMDIIAPFNLAERIQMVIDLILKKSDLVPAVKDTVATTYRNSPFKFDNFIRNPNEETKEDPKMTAREEYDEERLEELIKQRVEEELQKRENLEKERHDEERRIDTALRKAMDETVRGLKGKEVEIPNFKPAPDVTSDEDSNGSGQSGYFKTQLNNFGRTNPQMGSNFVPVPHAYWSSKHIINEIDEINQVIDNLVSFRDRLIAKLGHAQFKEKEQHKEQSEQPNINWDDVQKAEEQPKPFQKPQEQPKPVEPVKFTEEQRQRQREILGKQFGFESRYDQIGNENVRKLSEYSIRHSSQHLFDEALRNRTEEEAMISRSIEIYPSANLCKDSLTTRNFKYPSDFKELFSFVRVDGDRLYRINDSSVQPWNRSKPLGTIRMISENFGLFTATKLIIKVNEDAVEEYVDEYFDNPDVILDAVNRKYGYDFTPEEIAADSPHETPSQYMFRHSYYRVADELKTSLKESRNKFIKGLVRDSTIVVLNNMELYGWIEGKNPTNS